MLATLALALNAREKKRIQRCGRGLKLDSAGWTLLSSKCKQNDMFFL